MIPPGGVSPRAVARAPRGTIVFFHVRSRRENRIYATPQGCQFADRGGPPDGDAPLRSAPRRVRARRRAVAPPPGGRGGRPRSVSRHTPTKKRSEHERNPAKPATLGVPLVVE